MGARGSRRAVRTLAAFTTFTMAVVVSVSSCSAVKSTSQMRSACTHLRNAQRIANDNLGQDLPGSFVTELDAAAGDAQVAASGKDAFSSWAGDVQQLTDRMHSEGSASVFELMALLDQCDRWGAG